MQSTPDNSTLQGKLKKVPVIGRSKQITRNKEMEWGRNESIMHTSLQEQQDLYCVLEKELKKKRLD